jgi:hypothetical protein
MKYIIPIEMELDSDEEGLTSVGWNVYSEFVNAMNKLHDDYGWREIQHVGSPVQKKEGQ